MDKLLFFVVVFSFIGLVQVMIVPAQVRDFHQFYNLKNPDLCFSVPACDNTDTWWYASKLHLSNSLQHILCVFLNFVSILLQKVVFLSSVFGITPVTSAAFLLDPYPGRGDRSHRH